MNLGFCRWLGHLAKYGNQLQVMVHEPYLESGQGSWKQRLVAQVQRRMIRTVLESASRVYMSIPAWERYLRPYAPSDREMIWLPIPATVPVFNDPTATVAIRRRIGEGSLIIGHLGTYSAAITSVLGAAISSILRDIPSASVLLLGNGSEAFASSINNLAPDLRGRVHASGFLSNAQLSHHLSACDLMLQPFPDGLSTRRTSLMNALAHRLPVVSNPGHLTEELWEGANAVALAETGAAPDLAKVCTRLLHDTDDRKRIADAGAALYHSRFDWPNIVRTLRAKPEHILTVTQK